MNGEYIEMSMTWSEIVGYHIDALLSDTTPLRKQHAENELRRLATAMDKVNEAVKSGKLVEGAR